MPVGCLSSLSLPLHSPISRASLTVTKLLFEETTLDSAPETVAVKWPAKYRTVIIICSITHPIKT